MCGIFGFLSAPGVRGEAPGDKLFETIDGLLELGTGPGIHVLSDASPSSAIAQLGAARDEVYRWLGLGGFLTVLASEETQGKIRKAIAGLHEWIERLEQQNGGLATQSDWEFVHRLTVGGKDIAWQLERDLLDNMAPVRDLLGEASDPRLLAHAWQLNLLLRSLDRLEVRGRDSAGIAAYVRFPGPRALDSFLDGPAVRGERRRELDRRASLTAPTSALRPASDEATLLFLFKVANEVGRLGDNVAFLRDAIRSDELFQAALREPGAEIQCLAHTRWASNGIISIPNCHPVDGAFIDGGGVACGQGEVVAVLNGDIDNYRDLLDRYILRRGLSIDERITTDAKVIPLVVGHHYHETRDLCEAFRRAFSEFEGSMAIGVMAADRPGEFVFGQKGSGQGLFLGMAPGAVAIASELYGVVELTPRYVKAEGERTPRGEIFHAKVGPDGLEVKLVERAGARPVAPERIRTAEITTRDIHRGGAPHFFLKEIKESVESVRRTLRGKLETSGGRLRFHLGPEVLGEELLDGLRAGRIRRIICIGQGTAAIAAEGIAHLLERALARAHRPFKVTAMKATELSGHFLSDDMSDALVVAVSQSGTTTDTNRTVDMARQRGAWILGIVNRRNSDLVYKSKGVLYTSDGRDIEMSVASTKAFYAQNVAGQILALALAMEVGEADPAALLAEAETLSRLPDLMARTLELEPLIAELASRCALERRHWAVVGSGAGKVAADEIRIKLSELCYKSIALDYLEDKKHIDLSSEPMILVCANGAPSANVSDLVKEVAIFKAHRSLPIVITDEGEDRFDPYAAGAIKLPRGAGSLSYLLTAVVGHLFGYHAASALDRIADGLRAIRADVIHLDGIEDVLGGLERPPPSLVEKVVQMEGLLLSGKVDAGLGAGSAARLNRALGVLLGRMRADVLGSPGLADGLAHGIVAALSESIAELSRPIDAIKHQAKTVTVGISRAEPGLPEGALLRTLRELDLPLEKVGETNRAFLFALEPLVGAVEGATLYRVAGLDLLGKPTQASTIEVLKKVGCASALSSRAEQRGPLLGTKWGVVKDGDFYLGYGKTDERKILILPVIGEEETGHLCLCHLSLIQRGERETRLKALRAWPRRFQKLRIAVTERDVAWSDGLIDEVDNETLFLREPDAAAEELLASPSAASRHDGAGSGTAGGNGVR